MRKLNQYLNWWYPHFCLVLLFITMSVPGPSNEALAMTSAYPPSGNSPPSLQGRESTIPLLPTATGRSGMLQFQVGRHVVGFTPERVYFTGMGYALIEEFVGALPVEPIAENSAPEEGDLQGGTLSSVVYAGLWQGIDLRYERHPDGIVESFVDIAPQADVRAIRVRYNAPVEVQNDGGLRLAQPAGAGWFGFSAPVAWQDIGGSRRSVEVAFERIDDNTLGYRLGAYDSTRAVTIDPLLQWHTYLGSPDKGDNAYRIAIDGDNNIIVAGLSEKSWGYPVHDHSGVGPLGNWDIAVVKLDSNGILLWNTFQGAGRLPQPTGGMFETTWDNESISGLALDGNGDVYVAGASYLTWGNPVSAHHSPAAAGNGDGDSDFLVFKLDGASGELLWHTFQGAGISGDIDCAGFGCNDLATDLAVDNLGKVYVVGTGPRFKWSDTGVTPLWANLWSTGSHSVVFKLDGGSGALVWYTFQGVRGGGAGATGVAIDPQNAVYVTGYSGAWVEQTDGCRVYETLDFGNLFCPQQGPLHGNSGQDILVFKLASNGRILWHTFYGGADSLDMGGKIKVGPDGNIVVQGTSRSSWGTPLLSHPGGSATALFKLNSNGALLWNTFVKESSATQGLALDERGNIYLGGSSTVSWGFPEHEHTLGNSEDIMAVKLNSSGGFEWNTFYGSYHPIDGYGIDRAWGIATDRSGSLYLAGLSENALAVDGIPVNAHGDTIFGPMGDGPTDMAVLKLLQEDPTTFSGTIVALNDLWGDPAGDLVAVGMNGIILQYNGIEWSAMASGTTATLFGVWGSSTGDFFAVGTGGTIIHDDGTSWSAMASATTEDLRGVWGSGGANVYAVGANGTILQYDGTTWSAMVSGVTTSLNAVWGSAATDLFAVGANGTILHYDGTDWSPMLSGTTANLNAIRGTSGQNIFAVGANGTILHFDGINWAAMISGTTRELKDIWCTSGPDISVFGATGILLHYNGISWSTMVSEETDDLNAAWGSSEAEYFVVGNNGLIHDYHQDQASGVCGASNLGRLAAEPRVDLCLVGVPGPVSGGEAGPWTWSCAGSFGGPRATCSASLMAHPGTEVWAHVQAPLSAAWTAEANQAGASYGVSVAGVGDVNGDGYRDVMVSATGYDSGSLTDAGKVFLFLGSATGLAASPDWTAEGDKASAQFGSSVAAAGDVNGDGYGDVIIGAFRYGLVYGGEGKVFLYLGSATGLSATPAWTAEGDQEGDAFGYSVASAGDVNGDGYSDVIIGALWDTNTQDMEGRAFLYLGSATGLAASPSWTAESNQVIAHFGNAVAGAGDVNGDGFDDVIVGSSYYDNGQSNEGRAFLYLGSASGLSPSAVWTAEGDQVDAHFGHSIASAGDVNGDGYSDVLVGASWYGNGQLREGRAFLYLGSSSGLGAAPDWSAESNQAGAQFGFSVAGAGDSNGDGYFDVLISAVNYDNGQNNEGRVEMFFGSASGLALSPAWTVESNQADSQFGLVVAGAGDINGDGFAEVIVGSPHFDNGQVDEGRVFLYLGKASPPSATPDWTAEGGQAEAHFAAAVVSAGDVNGDGYGDVVVGTPDYTNGENAEGAASLYLGSASGLTALAVWTAEGGQDSATFGTSVASAGDVNGDGLGDVIVGAPGYSQGAGATGGAFVFLGTVSGLAAAPAWTAVGDQASIMFGSAVAAAGDINGDGYGDVMVGAPDYGSAGSREGAAFLYLGSASGLAAAPAWTAAGGLDNVHFGSAVAGVGDVNGDGYGDVVVGAYNYSKGQNSEGRVFLYLGSAMGLAASPAWTAEGDQAGALFGWAVAGAGDVNGDGYADVVIGARQYSNNKTNEGRIYLYLGSASGLAATPAGTVDGEQTDAFFGWSVAAAGDVNHDGYGDVLVGAALYDHGQGQTDEGGAFLFLGSASGLDPLSFWLAEGGQSGAGFGGSVTGGGDVNGDGYSDILVGASGYTNGESHEGRAALYHGNSSIGRPVQVGQRNGSDTKPLQYGQRWCAPAPLLKLHGYDQYGAVQAKLQYELKPVGTPFDTTGLVTEATWGNSDTPFSAILPLDLGTYHWRARLLYDRTTVLLTGSTPWFYPGIPTSILPSAPITMTAASSVAEDAGTTTISFIRPDGVCDASVAFATAEGTALEGSDYNGLDTTINFADGDTEQSLHLTLIADTVEEDNEYLTLRLFNADGKNSTPAQNRILTILSDRPGTGSNDPGDSDHDGLADDWEMLLFGDLITADGTTDSDGDGYTDLAEFQRATDPLSRESARVEAQRRLPPVLDSLTMAEELEAGGNYTLDWRLVGYDTTYSIYLALFDCTGVTEGTCGDSYNDSNRFYSAEVAAPQTIETSPWSYQGEVADYFSYQTTFTVPATRANGSAWPTTGTPLVVRFYQVSGGERAAGRESISLLLPGNLTNTYYDSTGRRIQKRICPAGGCN
ncbi:MAG: FG-GAP repeat protein [Proteobacteria bacterium]|nr:FG-GAP repeat protein [Pseudomonadota bacterium]MBU1687153.1 FG-GAP repeat protein [Pseudomonadota bacterium]